MTATDRIVPMVDLMHRGWMVPAPALEKTVWRVTAWAVTEDGMARRRLESAIATFTQGEALQYAYALARDEAGQKFPKDELSRWEWTVAAMEGANG